MRRILALVLGGALMVGGAMPAVAGGYRMVDWSDLKQQVYGDREILPGDGVVSLSAPTRSSDDRRVPVEVSARLMDGSEIRSVTLIIDENPMPVSAIFTLDTPRYAVKFGADMRMNGESPVRAIVETTDGRLLMAERLVKTSGQGACAAPPIGNPEAAIAAIGQMDATVEEAPVGISAPRMVHLDMKHPQHTGMQMDQISLHYILARYVDTVDVWAGEEKLFSLTGSISLSEDPAISFEVLDPEASRIRVRLEDIEGTVVDKDLALGLES